MAVQSLLGDSFTDPERQGSPRNRYHDTAMSMTAEPWWKIHFFRGMANDLRQRVPYYISDWTDAWDYRVVPATVYMYFAKYVAGFPKFFITRRFCRLCEVDGCADQVYPCSSILPALAFSLDMFQNTGSEYGVNEVLLSSVLGAVVFSLFAAQPLVIVGVTGEDKQNLNEKGNIDS